MDFHFKLIVPSDPRFLSIARVAVSEAGAICGLSEELCLGITLAVDEGLANIIRHGYKNRHDQEIELSCQAGPDQIVFTLLDCGEPPDPARICGQPLDEVSLSGRGTHLMKAVMDEVHYEQVPKGNQVRLVKRLPVASEG
jgi:anti-sigma regulatory factor (Ser/Thr protein kinase)